MERIREALERARRDRQGQGSLLQGNPRWAGAKRDLISDIDSISYTQTRTVHVSPQVLYENRVVNALGSGAFTDAYKMLRTRVLSELRANKWNAIAVTSPGESEGKTLTAINLAVSLAMEVGQTVLLVDANLRHPSVHEYFGLKPDFGLSDYLLGEEAIEDLLIHPGIGRFVILPGGQPLQNSSEMLSSPKMAELVRELKSRYPSRIIVFDLPPVLSVADALAFAPHVDTCLLVVEECKTKSDDVTRAAELLKGASNLVGVVLNKSHETRPSEEEQGPGAPPEADAA